MDYRCFLFSFMILSGFFFSCVPPSSYTPTAVPPRELFTSKEPDPPQDPAPPPVPFKKKTERILSEAEVTLILQLEVQFEDVSWGVEHARDTNDDEKYERLIRRLRVLRDQICCLDPNHKIGCD